VVALPLGGPSIAETANGGAARAAASEDGLGQVLNGRALAGTSAHSRFAEVFLPHLVDAYRLARWLAGSRADADDIVQEASLRAFRGIDSFSGINARSWVLSIVRNAAYTWLARNRSATMVSADDLDEGERAAIEARAVRDGAGPETPEAAVMAKADVETIRARVAALPPAFRDVLVLREIHDLGYREIAAIVEAPVGTVMSRLARARRILIGQAEGKGQ
jgi:RNA polymerase sigma factor (sigma-70 family)